MTYEPSEQDWRVILEPGERTRWRAIPGDTRMPKSTRIFWLGFGGLFAGIGAIFAIIGLTVIEIEAMFRLILAGLGSISLIVGLTFLIVSHRLHRQKIQEMRYALTDRRAVIHDSEVTPFRITPNMELDYQPGNPPSLWLREEETSMMGNGRPTMRKLGFAGIPEAQDLIRQIRDIQARLSPTVHNAG